MVVSFAKKNLGSLYSKRVSRDRGLNQTLALETSYD